MSENAQQRLGELIAKFTPDIAARTHDSIAKLRARIPGATIMVYDGYNALAIGFSAIDRTSSAVISIAVYPRWLRLCFLHGVGLPDPHRLLKGEGNQLRSMLLPDAATLDDPKVDALITVAVARSAPPFVAAAPERLLIKSVIANQRPRRPA